ncbi:hypothetical protein GCM10023235_26050 [Kitasatospora terrestris]|uniref:Uncharacterized protein n=1 Tax=Kitasatospora terrestris TaxID=258051 RepID=A0ABP9DK34_9ACTN
MPKGTYRWNGIPDGFCSTEEAVIGVGRSMNARATDDCSVMGETLGFPVDCGLWVGMRTPTGRLAAPLAEYGRRTTPRGEGAGLFGLQALAAAAKKKQPVTHDVLHCNRSVSAHEVNSATIPPSETRRCGPAAPPSGRGESVKRLGKAHRCVAH